MTRLEEILENERHAEDKGVSYYSVRSASPAFGQGNLV
jgi:hypothetical protein